MVRLEVDTNPPEGFNRDFYDLLWFLGRKIKPNFKVLNNAIHQTRGKSDMINEDNLNQFFIEKLSEVDFGKVKRDVARLPAHYRAQKIIPVNYWNANICYTESALCKKGSFRHASPFCFFLFVLAA